MENGERDNNPLRNYFAEALHDSLVFKAGLRYPDVEGYLCNLLVEFVHEDAIHSIHNAAGNRVESIMDLVSEADIRLNADSFAREREVHKYIGDYLLFLCGIFPELLKWLKAP